MIDVHCPCGGRFQVLNEQVATRARCPKCGKRAADILAAQAEGPAKSTDPVEAAEEPGAEGQPEIPCAQHPDQPATHNCLNCGKPLCMECVRENGYFCSVACKTAVQATQPNVRQDQELERVGQQVDRGLAVAATFARRAKIPALIAVVVLIGFFMLRALFRPQGKVTASLEVTSEMDRFHTFLLEPDRVIVQADDLLSLVDLSTQRKLWELDLRTLPAPPAETKIPAGGEEHEEYEFRDDPEFAGVAGDTILVRTFGQLAGIDRQKGTVRWQWPTPRDYAREVLVRDNAVWWLGSRSIVNLDPATGQVRWSITDRPAGIEKALAANRLALIRRPPPPPAPAAEEDLDEEPLTAGGGAKLDMRSLLGMARQGEREPKTQDYIVEFYSAGDGKPVGTITLNLTDDPQVRELGEFTCVVGGRDVVVFRERVTPLWKARVENTVDHVAGGGGVIAVVAGGSVLVYEAESGQLKWSRAGLEIENLAVAPDGSAYVTIALAKEQNSEGEAAKYRFAEVARKGMDLPIGTVICLLKLDPRNGHTVWGVKNIGGEVLFAGAEMYALDRTDRMDLLASQGPFVSHWSVRRLSPRNGKDQWVLLDEGSVHQQQALPGKVFVVCTKDPPAGRRDPTARYYLQMVEAD